MGSNCFSDLIPVIIYGRYSKKILVVIPAVPVALDPRYRWVLILIPGLTGIIEHIRIESELMHTKLLEILPITKFFEDAGEV